MEAKLDMVLEQVGRDMQFDDPTLLAPGGVPGGAVAGDPAVQQLALAVHDREAPLGPPLLLGDRSRHRCHDRL